MRIKRLELKNFRTFRHVVLEDIPSTLVFVSPNGRGKSSILEAIAGAHELIAPYHADNYPFKEIWQQRHISTWPKHLAPPVKIGAHQAEISIEVEATGLEAKYLSDSKITKTIGTAKFVIEDGNKVSSEQVNDTIKKLFQFHTPSAGIGFVDYVRAVRFYLNKEVGNFASELSDESIKQAFLEFHQPANEHNKFSSLKSFVVSTQLDDFTRSQSTGSSTDSLKVFREVFDHFFAPKSFVGYESTAEGGSPRIAVKTPNGTHDINHLSDGEKEILHIFAHLYRFRHLHNIVLWDTPESHLNAALESRIYDALQRIAPQNQFWIATHSLEFINSVPLNNIFIINQNGDAAEIERANGDERRTRIGMYQEMGAQIGLQLVSALVVFVEGKQANSDKRVLDRLVTPFVPGVNFVAGGSCENILALGTRTNSLLNDACANGDFLAVVDRDYRTDEEVTDTASKYSGRVFMWNVHEIENLFLDPPIMLATLKYFDAVTDDHADATIQSQLKQVGKELIDWIAADWVASELERQFQPPSRRISGDDPMQSLRKYTAALKAKTDAVTECSNIDSLFGKKRGEVESLLAGENWRKRLPGKQLLKKFLATFYSSITSENYIKAAISTVITNDIQISEIERLKTTLINLRSAVK